jgi:hypothetical protein
MRKSLVLISLVMVLSSSIALAADAWLGTWKVDLAKSRYSPGPAPKSYVLKFEAMAGGTQFTGDGVSADGKATHSTFLSTFDGKEVAYEGNPDADTASPRKIDDNKYDNTWKKGGKATITATVEVSADGKVMTITQIGTNAKGEAVNHRIVYNKQ